MRVGPNKAKIDEAVEHILWCVQWQDDGFIPIRILRAGDNGQQTVEETRWFNNRGHGLERKLRAFLKKHARDHVTALYSPCAFSKEQAKAQYALPNQVVYVDADHGRNTDFQPEPTRIIKSSETGEHWFWLLSRPLPRDDLQSVNRALTRGIGGDKSGHSPAKLFRLPGFANFKYHPPFRVALSEDTGEIYDADEILALASDAEKPSGNNVMDIGDMLTASKRLTASRIIERHKSKLNSNTRARLSQRTICGPMTVASKGRERVHYPGDDRSEIIWGIALDLRRAGATPAETLAVVTNTIFWKSRERDGKAENPERLIERIFDADPGEDDTGPDIEQADNFKSALMAIDPADWEGLPVPVRQWIIKDWIPFLKVTALYGDGGTGKTLLALMLAVSVALGHDFLGMKVKQGRVYALLGENDETDTHIALADICRHYGVALGDLRGRARIASRSGFDNILMHFAKGTGHHTELFNQLLVEVTEFDADLIILETAADLFGGNENVRGEVRQFIAGCCEALAKAANAAVVLCAHPSMTGLRSGDGTAGSTAWNNSARSRLDLHRDVDDEGHEVHPDFRVLERLKANFAARKDAIDLCWRDGVFIVNDPVKNRSTMADIDQKLISEIARAFEAGNPWSAHHQAGPRYIATWMGPNLRQSPRAAKKMLSRLLAETRIVEAEVDAHTHKKGLCTPDQAAKQRRNKKAK
ncbi:MAG: AAA family ATPase [Hyphomicrobiales bacterium]